MAEINEINAALMREAIEKFASLADRVDALAEAQEETKKSDNGNISADIAKAIQDAYSSISKSFAATLKAEISGIGSDIAGTVAGAAKDVAYKPFSRIGDQASTEFGRTYSAEDLTRQQVREMMQTGREPSLDEIRTIHAENSRLRNYQRTADELTSEALGESSSELGRNIGGIGGSISFGISKFLDILSAPIVGINPFGSGSVKPVDRVRNHWNETTGE